jgi:serine/threonine protein kinase
LEKFLEKIDDNIREMVFSVFWFVVDYAFVYFVVVLIEMWWESDNKPEYREHHLSDIVVDLLKKLLQKDPNNRFQSIKEIKRHPWLQSIDWDRVLTCGYTPPIVPGPHQCCIDEEFLHLPLDFEDSAMPVMTERRQSCYYESTFVKSMTSEKNTQKESQL